MTPNINQEIFRIPKGKSGYILGPGFTNKKRMEATSGAEITIQGRRNQECKAIVTGDESQRRKAIELLKEALGRSNSFSPYVGFTLLDIPKEYEGFILRLAFKVVPNDNNGYKTYGPKNSISFNKHALEIIKEDRLINSGRYSHFSVSNLSGKLYSFTTVTKLDDCLSEIISNVTSKKPPRKGRHLQRQALSDDEEFRLKINFGRELFTKLNKDSLNLIEWNKLRRGHNGITTSFYHEIGFFEDTRRIEILMKVFGFREVKVDQECLITILFTKDDKKNKFKLYRDANNGLWRIRKLTENIRRQAIIDIVTGTKNSPDLRFLLKSQRPSQTPIDEKYHEMFSDLQRSIEFFRRQRSIESRRSSDHADKMYFRQKDFKDFTGNFQCTSVRQSIVKHQFMNEHYQLNFISTLQDEEGRVTLEDTVNLVNRSWISPSSEHATKCESITTMNPTDPRFRQSIAETINYARQISRSMVGG